MLAVSLVLVKSGPTVTEPARSAWVELTPSLSTATVTPLPRVARQAWLTLSLLSHHSCCRVWSARAGVLAATTQIAVMPAAITGATGRGNLSGTPDLPSV